MSGSPEEPHQGLFTWFASAAAKAATMFAVQPTEHEVNGIKISLEEDTRRLARDMLWIGRLGEINVKINLISSKNMGEVPGFYGEIRELEPQDLTDLISDLRRLAELPFTDEYFPGADLWHERYAVVKGIPEREIALKMCYVKFNSGILTNLTFTNHLDAISKLFQVRLIQDTYKEGGSYEMTLHQDNYIKQEFERSLEYSNVDHTGEGKIWNLGGLLVALFELVLRTNLRIENFDKNNFGFKDRDAMIVSYNELIIENLKKLEDLDRQYKDTKLDVVVQKFKETWPYISPHCPTDYAPPQKNKYIPSA